ncbi:MAG: hypothetical protein GKS02_07375 [Alphaproteobacteria bacterium]|nr:hypothetical protein [Alphaproteobacteria bacterium]
MRLRYHLFAFLVVVAGFGTFSDSASAAGCKAPRDAADLVVNVNVDIGEPVISNSLSKAELGTSSFHGREGQILGTTESGFELRWAINYELIKWRNVYCFWTARADVDISYQQLDVNIAAEYAPGSCQYEAVLDHENEHVEVAQSVMRPYAQQIKVALTSLAIPTAHLPSVANSPEIAQEEVEEVFRQTLLPVRDKMVQLLSERQAEVDTLENYRRTWQRCREW